MTVADSGPLITFGRMGRINLLRNVLGTLAIPPAVYAEVAGNFPDRPGAEEVATSDWIQVRKPTADYSDQPFPPHLELGEREAILLAQQLNSRLLMDNLAGRQEAERRGLEVFGSLRVI